MRCTLIAGMLGFSLLSSPAGLAQIRVPAGGNQPFTPTDDSQNVQNHVITVSRSGEAFAKPDLGIMMMSIRSSSPIADEAVAENARKAKAVESALAGTGIPTSSYQITSVVFGQVGGPRLAGLPEMSSGAYDATQNIYIFFESADLNDVASLTEKSATIIEALRKAGAVPAIASPMYSSPMPMASQGSMIIYTIKDPVPYEHQALQVAITRARDAAQDIATGLGVQISGVRNVQSGYLGGNVVPRSGTSPLEGLKYRFFSPKIDELQIIANATVQYDFK